MRTNLEGPQCLLFIDVKESRGFIVSFFKVEEKISGALTLCSSKNAEESRGP